MMHKTCSINYGHLADLQKTLPTTDLNKKNFHLIKYPLATFIFSFLFNLYLFNTLMSGRNGWHLADAIFEYILFEEKFEFTMMF